MTIAEGNMYLLKVGMDRVLGKVLVTEVKESLILGELEKGPDFHLFQDLFQEHERAANDQLLSIADEIEDRIQALNPHVSSEKEKVATSVYDLQIMGETDVSFRLSPFDPAS